MMAFENVSQRVVFSYWRQLKEFVPVIPEHLSEGEHQAMEKSQKDLHGFFSAFYRCAYDDPAAFGLPVTEDVCTNEGDGKDEKRVVATQVRKVRVKMDHGIDFLWLFGRQGVLMGEGLQLSREDYTAYFAKSPRVKRKILKGLATVGLTVTEADDGAMIANTHTPAMMPALKAWIEACLRLDDERLARFLFTRCDLRVLDADYVPDVLDVLRTAVSPLEYEVAVELHNALVALSYVPSLRVGGTYEWRIPYQGKRAVKSTPFFEFEYEDRQKHQLGMHVKCAAANRLAAHLAQQSAALQEDFFHHASNCGGASCGWCKTRKALGPSKIEYGGETKTICWYMRRRFTELHSETVDLIEQYALLHEALVEA
ncbi:MAG: hypothetical protein MUQ10_13585 [Anaerolineae bacterium]|nr:hypothetical protein [Anaerolineae bacterium]